MEMMTKERPLYQKVKESILLQIRNEELGPGDPLPTESELESMFQVSRTTIRTAINELQNEGYITKQQGRGTFVASNSYEDCQAVLQSFTQDVSKTGDRLRTVLISCELIIPNEELKENMQCGDDPVLRIQRVRYINDIPSVFTTSYLPFFVYEKIQWKTENFGCDSLYEIIERVGIDMEYGEEIIEVCGATVLEASLLQIDVGHPMSSSKRKVFNKRGQLIEYGCTLTRGDRYCLHIKLKKHF